MLIKERSDLWQFVSDVVFICLGASLEAFSIRFLLIPNNVIDGGLVGIALILAKLSSAKYFSLLLIVITIPFLVMAFRTLGKMFLFRMGLALTSLVISSTLYEKIPADFISSSLGSVELMISGAIVLGLGVGLTLKFGGCVDGTEIIAILLQKTRGISVGTTILIMNFFIFTFAAIAYGHIATGVKSIITYILASYVMDFVNSGFRDVKMVHIFTSVPEIIEEKINKELKVGATLIDVVSMRSGRGGKMIMAVINKVHVSIIKDIVISEDKNAFIVVMDVSESINGTTHPVGFVKQASIL